MSRLQQLQSLFRTNPPPPSHEYNSRQVKRGYVVVIFCVS